MAAHCVVTECTAQPELIDPVMTSTRCAEKVSKVTLVQSIWQDTAMEPLVLVMASRKPRCRMSAINRMVQMRNIVGTIFDWKQTGLMNGAIGHCRNE